jgi:hypothetical protein
MSKQLSIVGTIKTIENEITFIGSEGWISQRGLAKLVGVSHTTIQNHIKKCKIASEYLCKIKGLHESCIIPVLYSIGTNNIQVLEIAEKIGQLGIRVLLAGNSEFSVPTTYKDALKQIIEKEEEKERLLGVLGDKQAQIDDDAILTEKSEEYFAVNKVKKLNSGTKLSGLLLTKASRELGIPVRQVYNSYDHIAPNSYHEDVWLTVYPNIKL